MTNVLLVLPAGMVTDAGSVTMEVLLLASEIAAPPAGAAGLIVTVPVDCVPFVKAPMTEVGDRVSAVTVTGEAVPDTVSDAVPYTLPEIAITLAVPAVEPAE
jgi:hypothetical protein